MRRILDPTKKKSPTLLTLTPEEVQKADEIARLNNLSRSALIASWINAEYDRLVNEKPHVTA